MRTRGLAALALACASIGCGGKVADFLAADTSPAPGEDVGSDAARDSGDAGDDSGGDDIGGDAAPTPLDVSTPEVGDTADIPCGPVGTMLVSGSASTAEFRTFGLGSSSGLWEFFGDESLPESQLGFVSMWPRTSTLDERYTLDRAIFRAPGPGAQWSCATSGSWAIERAVPFRVRWQLDALRTIGSCDDHHATGELHICAGGGTASHGAAKCAPDSVGILGVIDGKVIDQTFPTHVGRYNSLPTPTIEAELETHGFLYFGGGSGYLVRPPTPADPSPAILCFGSGEAYWSGPFEVVARDIGVAGACPIAPGTGVERGCATN